MVEFLSSWAKNLTLAVIIVSILEMILPNNKTKKYVKMIMGLYILFTIITPFFQNSSKIDFSTMDFNEITEKTQVASTETINQDSMDVRLKQMYQEQLQKDIQTKLENKGYQVEECKVQAEISQEQEQSGIKQIVLKVEKKEEETQQDEKENSVEAKMVDEIQKIKKIEISMGNEKKNQTQEKNKMSQSDLQEVRKFLKEEYGVSEKCLKIN